MAKLKKSEAFTVEREKEIQQVSRSCMCTIINDICWLYAVFLMNLQVFVFIGCGICKRTCSDYEGFIGTSHRPGQHIPSFYKELIPFFILYLLKIDVLYI